MKISIRVEYFNKPADRETPRPDYAALVIDIDVNCSGQNAVIKAGAGTIPISSRRPC